MKDHGIFSFRKLTFSVRHGYRNFSFSDVHVEAAGVLAELAQKHEVDRFIQMSALNADIDSPSKFLSTKVTRITEPLLQAGCRIKERERKR